MIPTSQHTYSRLKSYKSDLVNLDQSIGDLGPSLAHIDSYHDPNTTATSRSHGRNLRYSISWNQRSVTRSGISRFENLRK